MNADTPPPVLADADSLRVRGYLAEALRLDLVGPVAGHELAEERLPGWVRPSNWYLTGFLVPSDAPPEQRCDADEDDPLGETLPVAWLLEESTEERAAAKKGFFPSPRLRCQVSVPTITGCDNNSNIQNRSGPDL